MSDTRLVGRIAEILNNAHRDPGVIDNIDVAHKLIRELDSWEMLMHILDYNYPATVFPTLPDNPDRDPGPRIVSLLRTINEIRKSTDD